MHRRVVMSWSRRKLLASAPLWAAGTSAAHAQQRDQRPRRVQQAPRVQEAQQQPPRIRITGDRIEPIPIAVSPFFGGTPPDAEFADNIPQVVAADLERSGMFRPIDRAAFIQDAASMRSAPP